MEADKVFVFLIIVVIIVIIARAERKSRRRQASAAGKPADASTAVEGRPPGGKGNGEAP